MTLTPAPRAKLHAIGDGKPADPTFATRADLEVWSRETAALASVAATLALATSYPEYTKRIYTSAIEQIRRVTIAHLHLPDAGHLMKRGERTSQHPKG